MHTMNATSGMDGTPPAVLYGPDRLVAELRALGHEAEVVTVADGTPFAIIAGYEITLGRFAGRVIDLGIPAPPNFPLAVGAAVHVRAVPPLLEFGAVEGVRNVIASPLGPDWQYWSKNFNWLGAHDRSAARLMHQINAVFAHA